MCNSLQPHGLYVAHQAALSMGFSRQEYWSGLPCSPPEDLSDPGIELTSPTSPALPADLHHWVAREALMEHCSAIKNEIICSNVNGPRGDHTKWSKSERERNTRWYHWYEESKYGTDELFSEKEPEPGTKPTHHTPQLSISSSYSGLTTTSGRPRPKPAPQGDARRGAFCLTPSSAV